MWIELVDEHRRRSGWIEIDPAARPTRVRAAGVPARRRTRWLGRRGLDVESGRPLAERAGARGTTHFLSWDTALDDAGRIRRCLACGCTDLYRTKAFPQITGIVVVLAFMGAVIGVLGLATTPVLIAMVVVLVLDVALLLLARKRLVCYRCQAAYRGLPIARYHGWWDRTVAERYGAVPAPAREAPLRVHGPDTSMPRSGIWRVLRRLTPAAAGTERSSG